MLWIILKSYRSNLRRYLFAIIALAMATVVSALGLSGVDLMANMWRYPFTAWTGGHILIGHRYEDTSYTDYRNYSLISYSRVSSIVKDIYPEAKITATLQVPALVWLPGDQKYFLDPVVGRAGSLDTWYLNAPLRQGEPLNEMNTDEEVFLMRGLHLDHEVGPLPVPTRISTYKIRGEKETYDLAGAEEQTFSLIGTTNYPAWPGMWGHLGVVQHLSSTPSDRVRIIGVGLPGLHAKIDSRVDLLRHRLAAEMPQLSVMTADEFGELIADDLVMLRDAAGKYTPILLLIALQVVIATALAVVHNRRRELSLLRIVGFSYKKIWLLFTLECLLSSVLACVLGYAAAKVAAFLMFQSSATSPVPFGLTLIVSLVVSIVIGRWAVASSVPAVLRNS